MLRSSPQTSRQGASSRLASTGRHSPQARQPLQAQYSSPERISRPHSVQRSSLRRFWSLMEIIWMRYIEKS